jgi:hypothetical protein
MATTHRGGDSGHGDEVTLYTSLRGLTLSFVSPGLLIVLGLVGSQRVGLVVVPTLLLGLGVATGTVLALGLPIHVTFTRSGVVRRCALRTHTIVWPDIVAIERGPGSRRPGAGGGIVGALGRPPHAERAQQTDAQGDGTSAPTGGLVARATGRRRWMLCDQVESRQEFAAWTALVRSLPEPPAVLARRPAEGAVPTDLYRRRG